jgi:hypothetical protein
MIVFCLECRRYYDDQYRLTYCPHEAFNANDGQNNFAYNLDAYLSDDAPKHLVDSIPHCQHAHIVCNEQLFCKLPNGHYGRHRFSLNE